MRFGLLFQIAWRYVRSRESGAFVTFISVMSTIGIALGVAALLCILSVMNGFEAEARERLASINAHVTIEWSHRNPATEARVRAWLSQQTEVAGVAVSSVSDALLVHGQSMEPAKLRGIRWDEENQISALSAHLVEGANGAAGVAPGSVILGRELAETLGVSASEPVTVLVPESQDDGELTPHLAQWSVAGQFEAGLSETDGVYAIASRDEVDQLAPHAKQVARVRLTDPQAAMAFRVRAQRALSDAVSVSDWTLDNATYFRATHLEKIMMTVILSLIVIVAIFNVIAMLIMVVRSKRLDIAVLRTLGLRPEGIEGIFMLQGLIIGWGGALAGLALGVLLATHAGQVANAIETLFHFQILSSDVYYITTIPSQVRAGDVVLVLSLSLGMSFLATVLPARRAARTLPSEVLRYDQ